jgi:trehalose synthase
MASRKQNALTVNALQRCSTIIVQNSLREGFGLTATEAMWKGVCVVGTRACGLRQQIRGGIDGVLIQDPSDPDEIARRIDDILEDVPKRNYMAGNGRQRVHDEFLIFTQLCHWLRTLSACASAPPRKIGEQSASSE